MMGETTEYRTAYTTGDNVGWRLHELNETLGDIEKQHTDSYNDARIVAGDITKFCG